MWKPTSATSIGTFRAERKTKKNTESLFNKAEDPGRRLLEQVKVLSDFFALFFTGKINPEYSQIPEPNEGLLTEK